jgi:ADP-ribose pyrophosphatase YjhB (NUDIX family)
VTSPAGTDPTNSHSSESPHRLQSPDVSQVDLLRWSEALAGIARTGLGFTQSQYERERYEEVLAVAADIGVAAGHTFDPSSLVEHWMGSVGEGISGYVTPKIGVGAVVGDDEGRMLLIQRAESGVWLYPTGWADIGYSAAEVAVKEVHEETGIEAEPVQLLGVFDGHQWGARYPLYLILVHCRMTGGSLRPHPLEVTDVGWFHRDAFPSPMFGVDRWRDIAFAAIDGQQFTAHLDQPRPQVWRGNPDSSGSDV